MKSLNILMLSHLFPNEADSLNGIFVYEQVMEFRKIGHQVNVVSPVPFVPGGLEHLYKKWMKFKKIQKERMVQGVHVHHPRTLFFPRGLFYEFSPFWYFLFSFSTVNRIRRNKKLDIIHAQAAIPDGFAGLMFSKIFRIPLIVTTHGDDLQNRIFQNSCIKRIIGLVYQECHQIILVSEKLKKALERYYHNISENKIKIVYNGINMQRIEKVLKADSNSHGKILVLTSVGRLTKIKGHEWVIKALPHLIKRKINVLYLIIGNGDEEKNILNLIKHHGLENHVKLLGFMSNEEALKTVSDCDIFVLPSYNESFGIAYLEAMALAKPVIACKGQGIADIIKDGENGFLVKPQNYSEIVEKISMLSKKNLRRKIGINAQRTVLKNFSWEKNAALHTQIYSTIARSRI